MPVSRTYRCLNCMEGTVTRSYDVSHLTRTCEACGEFERHVNQRVVDQYEAFEADPPEALDWAGLDRTRKFIVAERVARHGRSVESLAGDRREPDIEGSEEADADDGAAEDEPADDRAPADAAISRDSAATTEPDENGSGDASDGDEDTTPGMDREETDPDADGDTPAGHDSTPSGD